MAFLTLGANARMPGPPKEPKIMDQYPKIEGIGSIGSIILAILEAQVHADLAGLGVSFRFGECHSPF